MATATASRITAASESGAVAGALSPARLTPSIAWAVAIIPSPCFGWLESVSACNQAVSPITGVAQPAGPARSLICSAELMVM